MYEWMKKLVLRWFKVPSEPDDPMGDVNSLLVFRASYNFFRYRFYWWLVKNVFGLASAVIVGVLAGYEYYPRIDKKFGPGTAFQVMLLIAAAVVLYSLFQTFVSYMAMRMDYELRWYKVSDRSLRIREGVAMVREMTMTFANIQNIEIVQGPLQRWFGIADLKVESAGGGGGMATSPGKGLPETLGFHVAYFRGIDNAEEIRDIMRNRLEKIRSSGLGGDTAATDPVPPGGHAMTIPPELPDGLKRIRDEAALLRAAVARMASPR